jgi:cellulose biosynthesis protein BcsQ
MKATLDLARDAMDFRPALSVAILVTRRDPRTIQSREVAETLRSTNFDVLKTELCNRVDYQEFPASGLGLTRYNASGKAAHEVITLVDELETRYGKEETTNA